MNESHVVQALLKIKDLISVTSIAGFAVYSVNALGFPQASGIVAGLYCIASTFFLYAELLPTPKDPRYDDN